MDETPVFFDSPFSNTINKKGATQIEIVTSGGEKDRSSFIIKKIYSLSTKFLGVHLNYLLNG